MTAKTKVHAATSGVQSRLGTMSYNVGGLEISRVMVPSTMQDPTLNKLTIAS